MCLGIPGQIVAIEDAEKKLGVVNVGGVRRVTMAEGNPCGAGFISGYRAVISAGARISTYQQRPL